MDPQQNIEQTTDQTSGAETTPICDVPVDGAAAVKPKGIKGLIEYIKSHEELRQMVLFVLFSFCCAAAQTVTQFVLKYAIGAFNTSSFSWFLFDYPQEKGLAEFIGFICGSIIGQVMTFILNRKKTFKATNNVVIAGIMYTIIAVCIILLQTYLGSVVTKACKNAAAANQTQISGFVDFLITCTGMFVGGIAALILSFLGNKYLVMRDWGHKKDKQAAEAEAVAADNADTESGNDTIVEDAANNND